MDTPQPDPISPEDTRLRATLAAALVWLTQFVVGLLIVALTRRDLVTGCEGDGHYLRVSYLRCGDLPLYVQSGTASWPWLYPWLSSQLAWFVAPAYLAGRLISVAAMATLTTTVFVCAWWQWASVTTALVAALVIGTTPQLLYYGTLVSTDVLSVALSTLALPFALGVLRDRRLTSNALFAGVFAALGAQARYQAYPAAIVLGVVLGLAATRGQRARTAWWYGVGFALVVTLCAALPFYRPGDWGGLVPAWAARSQTASPAWEDVLGRYAHSAALLAWHVDYLPLLGLFALARLGLDRGQPGRDALVLIAPSAVQFAALGWFPSSESAELRRLFLPVLPICALGSAVLWRRLRAWEGPRALVTATVVWASVLLTANQTLAEFPIHGLFPWGVPWPGLGFDSPQRRWDFDRTAEREHELTAQAHSLDALLRLLEQNTLGCAPTITNDVLASVMIPSPVLCRPGMPDCPEERGLDNDALGRILPGLRASHRVRWVLEAPYQDRFWLDPRAPIGTTGATLTERAGPDGYRLYELTLSPRPAP
jgi:hypothetical protein